MLSLLLLGLLSRRLKRLGLMPFGLKSLNIYVVLVAWVDHPKHLTQEKKPDPHTPKFT